MTKAFPRETAHGVREWICVFSDYGIPANGQVDSTVQGAYESYRQKQP